MLARKSIYQELPEPIQNFVKKHHIRIINNECYFNQGVDNVFFLLSCKAPSTVGCALANMKEDPRFNEAQRKELRKLVLDMDKALNPELSAALPAELPRPH